MIFIPRFAAVALGILLRPAPDPSAVHPADADPPAIAGFDRIETVFVGTVLDVWHLGDRQVARFVVERPGGAPGSARSSVSSAAQAPAWVRASGPASAG